MKFSGSKSQGCLAMIIRDFRKRHHSCDGKGYNVINLNLQEIELSRIDMFRWISQLTINVCFCQTRKKLGLFPYFPFVLSARDISRTSRRFCRLKQNGVSKKNINHSEIYQLCDGLSGPRIT